jgi:hypothetical protein
VEAILVNAVVIADYDASWPATFQQLRDRLAATLGPLAVAIEHVGSTAVPGLAAKPIIDLDVMIADRADLPAVIEQLRPLGYLHEGDLGVPGREAFTTPPAHHPITCTSAPLALPRSTAISPFATPSVPTRMLPGPTATSSAPWPLGWATTVPATPRPRAPSSSRSWLPCHDDHSPMLVRAGSAQHQKPLVPSGHERSAAATQTRRSQAIGTPTSHGEAAWDRVRAPPRHPWSRHRPGTVVLAAPSWQGSAEERSHR